MRHLTLQQLADRARQGTWIVELRSLREDELGMHGQLAYVHRDCIIGLNVILKGQALSFASPAVFLEAATVTGWRRGSARDDKVEQAVLGAVDSERVRRDLLTYLDQG